MSDRVLAYTLVPCVVERTRCHQSKGRGWSTGPLPPVLGPAMGGVSPAASIGKTLRYLRLKKARLEREVFVLTRLDAHVAQILEDALESMPSAELY